MNEVKFLKRKIYLKRQAVKLTKDEILELQLRLALIILKERYEDQIGEEFDPMLS